MKSSCAIIGVIVVSAFASAPAPAHHSGAMFEAEKVITVEGTVKDFEYTNPHSWLYITVRDDKGEETVWGFEAEGPSALMRAGIKAKDATASAAVCSRMRAQS